MSSVWFFVLFLGLMLVAFAGVNSDGGFFFQGLLFLGMVIILFALSKIFLSDKQEEKKVVE